MTTNYDYFHEVPTLTRLKLYTVKVKENFFTSYYVLLKAKWGVNQYQTYITFFSNLAIQSNAAYFSVAVIPPSGTQ